MREGEEECDSSDLSGKSCEELEQGAGALACTDECKLDKSQCNEPEPTGSWDPGTSSGSTPEPDSATGSENGETATEGCSCHSSPPSDVPTALGLALAALAPRRRRRWAASAVLLLGATSMLACNGLEPHDTLGEATTTGSSTGEPAIDPRFFDVFHDAAIGPGYRNTDPDVITFWGDFEVFPGRPLEYRKRVCAHEPEVQQVAWTYDADAGALRLLPGDDGRIHLGACSFASAALSFGAACDEVWLAYTEPRDCGATEDGKQRFLPGRACPEQVAVEGESHVSSDACFFEVAWCDDRPLPACQAP